MSARTWCTGRLAPRDQDKVAERGGEGEKEGVEGRKEGGSEGKKEGGRERGREGANLPLTPAGLGI